MAQQQKPLPRVGDRVAVYLDIDGEKKRIRYMGLGVRVPDQVPVKSVGPIGQVQESAGVPVPVIQLDDGGIVFDPEVHWGDEADVLLRLGNLKAAGYAFEKITLQQMRDGWWRKQAHELAVSDLADDLCSRAFRFARDWAAHHEQEDIQRFFGAIVDARDKKGPIDMSTPEDMLRIAGIEVTDADLVRVMAKTKDACKESADSVAAKLPEIARAVVAASDVTKAAREAFLEHPTTKLPPIGGGNGPAEA